MGLFDFFSPKTTSNATSSTTSNATDNQAAGDNGAVVVGSGGTYNQAFSDNAFKAFEELGQVATLGFGLANSALTSVAKNSTGSLAAVTAAPNQLGAQNATLIKLAPYGVAAAALVAIIYVYRK